MITVSIQCDSEHHGAQMAAALPSGNARSIAAAHSRARTDADAKGWRHYLHGRSPAQWLCPRCQS